MKCNRHFNSVYYYKILEDELNEIAVCVKFAHTAEDRLKNNNLSFATWMTFFFQGWRLFNEYDKIILRWRNKQ